MRILIFLLSLFCMYAPSYGQNYDNEWIDYSKTYYSFPVAKNGTYRISYNTLQNSGINTDPTFLKLISRGEEVSIYISDETNFGPGDYIEFVGLRNDGYFDTQLYQIPEWQPDEEISQFTDNGAESIAMYYLVSDSSSPRLRFNEVQNDLSNTPPAEDFFMYRQRRSYPNVFYAGNDNQNNWTSVTVNLSEFEEGEGFITPELSDTPNFIGPIITESIYTDTPLQSQVRSKYIGRSNALFTFGNDHHMELRFNEEVVTDHFHNGLGNSMIEADIPTSMLTDPLTNMSAVALNDIDLAPEDANYTDKFSLAYVEVTYPRLFEFSDDPFFEFELDNTSALYFEARNVDAGNDAVLYDLNNNTRISTNKVGDYYPFHLPASNASRDLYISSQVSSDVSQVNQLRTLNFTDYSLESNNGDFTIIYHPSLRSGPTDQVQRYADYRASSAGGSFQVALVDVTELYDQFSHGIVNHPLAIQSFNNYSIDKGISDEWTVRPNNLFLLGRSISYDSAVPANENFAKNLVPTYGHRGSDNLLSARPGLNHLPQLATGRISALDSETIRIYLDKVIEHELVLNMDLDCNKEDRLWRKHIMHLGGGSSSAEANQFKGFLDGYRDIVDLGSNMGGKVVETFVKTDGAIGTVDTPPEVVETVDDGVSVLTLFGHSNAEIFDFGLSPPEDYNNKGKYGFLLSNSCFIGDVHSTSDDVLAFKYVNIPDKAFIGFYAAVGFGFPSFLNVISKKIYTNLTDDLYGETLGDILRQSHRDVFFDDLSEFGISLGGNVLTSQEFTLQGDPAVRLASFELPEYSIEGSDINITPSQPTVATESVELEFIIYNLGRATQDSLEVLVQHTPPEGDVITLFVGNIAPIAYSDTLVLELENQAAFFGQNNISIRLNPSGEIAESCLENNDFNRNLLILSDEPSALEPCNNSVVSSSPVLKASTPTMIMDSRTYRIQIDTTPEFNSADLLETSVTQVGGVFSWEPSIAYSEGQTYFWRVARDRPEPFWQTQSFTYFTGSAEGWIQADRSEVLTNRLTDLIWLEDEEKLVYPFGIDVGSIRSEDIGPASSWTSVEWETETTGTGEEVSIQIFGISDVEESLMINSTVSPVDISTIDAEQFPFIRIEYNVKDEVELSPAMLLSWKVLHDKVPELSFDQSSTYSFLNDTIYNNGNGSLEIAIANVNQHASGDLNFDCKIIGPNNEQTDIDCPTIDPIAGNGDAVLNLSFETAGLGGESFLQVEMNPEQSFDEKFEFNNALFIPFFIQTDAINPIVDVTFDGVNIVNNDLVSSNPEILINVMDENTVQALSDTSIVEVYVKYPSGQTSQIELSSPDITFIPANGQDLQNINKASVIYSPEFTEDGFYELRVKAADASGNQSSSAFDYLISFEIVTNNSISNVVNYPNPFTTQTQFIYTLTGSQLPEVFNIQVMTVTGRVVREFGMDELGTPQFGKNISPYIWDGTDQFGNELANGVYFYRVITKYQGEQLDIYSNDSLSGLTDSFGEHNIGKMYLMR